MKKREMVDGSPVNGWIGERTWVDTDWWADFVDIPLTAAYIADSEWAAPGDVKRLEMFVWGRV